MAIIIYSSNNKLCFTFNVQLTTNGEEIADKEGTRKYRTKTVVLKYSNISTHQVEIKSFFQIIITA